MSCNPDCQEDILNYANLVSGLFTAIAVGVSCFQVLKHLKNYTNPFLQNKIITIIFMAPFYALTSFLTILTHDKNGYFTLFRDIYEAVLIYAFFNLLSSYLAYDPDQKCINYDRIYDMLATKGVRQHPKPMNWIFRDMILISPIRGEWFFKQCRLYILQYLAIKPITTLIMIIDYLVGQEPILKWILVGIVFISVSLSLYYLVLFYSVLKEDLAYAKPLLKLLSVKLVLFFTFWQEAIIAIFEDQILMLFEDNGGAQGTELIEDFKCILICFEMVILSIVTAFAFSYKDFRETQKKNWLLEKQGMKDLAKKLMNDVITENFVTAIEDLKELKNPLQDPFKSYKPSEVKTDGVLLAVDADISSDSTPSTSQTKDYNAVVHERPFIIPNFMKQPEFMSPESSQLMGNTTFRSQDHEA